MPHTHRILVVDDDRGVRDLFADVLARGGAAVATASDGSQAVQVIASGPSPCLVLADVLMPRMDGWDLSRAVQRMDPGLPVVLVTADRLLSIRAPVRDKPSEPAEIEALVRNHCRASQADGRQQAQRAG